MIIYRREEKRVMGGVGDGDDSRGEEEEDKGRMCVHAEQETNTHIHRDTERDP